MSGGAGMAVVETLTLLEVEAATKSILSEKDILYFVEMEQG